MAEFKLNGKSYCGSTNYASAISYTEEDGSKTTVQDKIDSLGGFTPIIDETGQITGYKTSVGGADTVFPFKKGMDTSDATATAAQITEGFTAYVNGELIVGTRPAAPQTLSGTVQQGIPAGYATHQIKVTFNPPFDVVPKFTHTIQCFNDDTTGRFLYVQRDHAMFQVVHSHGVETSSVKITWTATVQ